MTARQAEIIELIHREVKPALGCTEPVAVALAVAKAAEIFAERHSPADEDIFVDVEVSGNILKNGMGVGIPGTGMVGLPIAAALGAVCGRSAYGLEVLREVDDEAVRQASSLVDRGRVAIRLSDTDKLLYVNATVRKEGSPCASASIADDHDRIVSTSWDGRSLSDIGDSVSADGDEGRSTLDYHLTVREILDFAEEVDVEDIRFILDDRRYNWALAEEGLSGEYGLKVGRTIMQNRERVFGDDFVSYAMSVTAAASDARMAGCTLAAMSNSGSGNQGITVSMPVIAYAKYKELSDERLAKALIISNLVAIHIKGYLGKLSALCGCVVASTGAACGIAWLRGGGYEEICASIKNMIGNITGMVCDGAKEGCAMKVASGVCSAVQSAVLALDGICVSEHDGIIEKDIEKTIRNLGEIGSKGMKTTDNLILRIMSCK